jgi:hypothetical protein
MSTDLRDVAEALSWLEPTGSLLHRHSSQQAACEEWITRVVGVLRSLEHTILAEERERIIQWAQENMVTEIHRQGAGVCNQDGCRCGDCGGTDRGHPQGAVMTDQPGGEAWEAANSWLERDRITPIVETTTLRLARLLDAYAARKVAEERERCAQLIKGGKTGGNSEYARGWDNACEGYAAAILNQEPS